MKLFHYEDVKADEVEGEASKVSIRWLITKEIGAKNFAMRLIEIGPGGHTPFHKHSWEHEVFILEGEGVILEDKNEKSFKSGDVIFVPQNENHQFKNESEKNVKFLCLIPCDPEK
ncbi:MAG: cupin domain-containing protein [Candidatus Bathyarchaeota archaeon]|jgi:quercetin dioxygenase-like cupin family protein